MTTHAQYQQPHMASNAHEFGYPAYTWDTDPTYFQTSMADESGYMAYTYQPNCNPSFNDPYAFNPEPINQRDASSFAKTDYSFEQPPVLSSTSDSGASIQSAMSSHVGSPATQSQQAGDWNQHNNMFPNILQPENMFPVNTFETDTIPVVEKEFVGESTKVSSVRDLSFPSPSVGAASPVPNTDPPAVTSSTIRGTASLHATDGISLESRRSPAGSSFQFHPQSPVFGRVKQQRQTPTRLARCSNAGGDSQRLYAPRSPSQSPFFSQSSGHFVPPLGFSCSSPFLQS